VVLTDLFLLKHLLWYAPEEAEEVEGWLLENLLPDPGVQQMQFLLDGLLARANKHLPSVTENGKSETEKVSLEAAALAETAKERLWAAMVRQKP
jgi:hypothetical protein